MVSVITNSRPMRLVFSLLIILISINVSAEGRTSTSELKSISLNLAGYSSFWNKPMLTDAPNFSKEKNDKKKKQAKMTDVDIEKDDAVLVVFGEGSTKDEATKVALRSAIEQAFGTFVSSNTAILNDNLIKDDITTVSSGNIKSFKYISENQKDGKWYVSLQTSVSVGKLTSYVQQKGGTTELAGATFAMDIKMKKLYKQNEETALKHLMDELKIIVPQMFDYSIEASSPKSSYNSKNKYYSDLKVSIKTNENYTIVRNLVWNTLSALCIKSKEEVVDLSEKGLHPRSVRFYTFGNDHQRYSLIIATQLPVTYLSGYDNNQYVVFRSEQFFKDLGKLIKTTLSSFVVDVGFDKLTCTIDEMGRYGSSGSCYFDTYRKECYFDGAPPFPCTDDISIGYANEYLFPVAESAKWTLNGKIDFTLEQVERISNIKVYSMQQLQRNDPKLSMEETQELIRNFETAIRVYGQLLQEKPTMTLEMLDEMLKDNSKKEIILQEVPTFSKEQLDELLKSYQSISELPNSTKAMFEEALKSYKQEEGQ